MCTFGVLGLSCEVPGRGSGAGGVSGGGNEKMQKSKHLKNKQCAEIQKNLKKGEKKGKNQKITKKQKKSKKSIKMQKKKKLKNGKK